MGRPSNRTERRGQIVDALQKVMAKSGYESASVQAIAQQAGLSPGLVHYHFSSKQAILVELIARLDATAQARYQEKKSSSSNAKQTLQAYIDAALALDNNANPEAVASWVVIGAESIRQQEVREQYQKIVASNLAELHTLLFNFVKENKIKVPKQTITNLAALVFGAIEGSYQLASTAAELTPKNYAGKTLMAMILSFLQD